MFGKNVRRTTDAAPSAPMTRRAKTLSRFPFRSNNTVKIPSSFRVILITFAPAYTGTEAGIREISQRSNLARFIFT